MNDQHDSKKIIVDEDWKSRVEAEREQLRQQEAQQSSSGAKPTGDSKQHAGTRGTRMQVPPASLRSLIDMLALQAAGEMAQASQLAAEPKADSSQDSEHERDPALHLELARHLIDLLGVLEEKTAGHRTAEESDYLSRSQHELRMAFVELRSHIKA